MNELIGTIEVDVELIGSISQDDCELIAGEIAEYIALPHYSGEYEVTPAVYSQTLCTDGKIADANITVNPIPYVEAPNEAGGITVTIG